MNDAYDRVANNNDHKKHVLERTSSSNKDRKNKVYSVEKRADILENNLLNRARFHARVNIDIAVIYTLAYLCTCKPLNV